MNATESSTDASLVERLNRECFCIGADLDALRAAIAAELEHGSTKRLSETHPHLFSTLPVFVSKQQVLAMQRIVDAVESVVANPRYRSCALAAAPAIAQIDVRAASVFMGYDFHVGAGGPSLIEINTNAGGAMLNAALARAQRACCAEVDALFFGPDDGGNVEDAIVAAFREEWRLSRGDAKLSRIAIVDDAPTEQYLYPEFLLFERLFESHGIAAVTADPAALEYKDGALRHRGERIDLVYNRSTDFYFERPESAALRAAYTADAAVVTPHPRAHALYANKKNLATLTDPAALESFGIDRAVIDTLARGIPHTIIVENRNADRLWRERKRWFFKPACGFGSRGSYRGDKVTRRVFAEICRGDPSRPATAQYVAQRLVPPGERASTDEAGVRPLKVDLRNYVYRGRVQLIAARLYQGQTTNFRTPGGGFAPVFHPRADAQHPPTAGRVGAGLPAKEAPPCL